MQRRVYSKSILCGVTSRSLLERRTASLYNERRWQRGPFYWRNQGCLVKNRLYAFVYERRKEKGSKDRRGRKGNNVRRVEAGGITKFSDNIAISQQVLTSSSRTCPSLPCLRGHRRHFSQEDKRLRCLVRVQPVVESVLGGPAMFSAPAV